MKFAHMFALALALGLYCSPAVAQHGHPGGMGAGGMGGGGASSMGHGVATHNSNMNNISMSHGQTMDQILTRNTKLAGKIQTLTGMSAQQACSGFKNLGQCVAAAHVSKNLDINFACLRAIMIRAVPPEGASCPAGTGTKSMSLGKSIQALRPTADAKTETKKATKQADQDMKESSS